MDPQLLRNCMKMFVAVFLTAAIASWCQRVQFLWYPLMAVIIVVDDNDDKTIQAASARILGTVAGGLVTFLVHTVLTGWIGVVVSLLLIVPILRLFGWQSGLGTAGTLSVMFLMVPTYEALNWAYVFNRAMDTVVGCVVALLVGLLFWPRRNNDLLLQLEQNLQASLAAQLTRYRHWQQRGGTPPPPLSLAPLTASLQRMDDLVQQQRHGPQAQQQRARNWERRLRLWQRVHFHWGAWERLMASLPQGSSAAPPSALLEDSVAALERQLAGDVHPTPHRDPHPWQALAQERQWPLLPLLALAEEWRPLHASLGALHRP